MNDSRTLLREIREAAHVIGIAPSTLCQRAVKNGALAQRLQAGGRATLETAAKVRGWIARHRPKMEAAE